MGLSGGKDPIRGQQQVTGAPRLSDQEYRGASAEPVTPQRDVRERGTAGRVRAGPELCRELAAEGRSDRICASLAFLCR